MPGRILSALAMVFLLAACQGDRTPAASSATQVSSAGAGRDIINQEALDPNLPSYPGRQYGDRVFFDYDSYTLKPEGRSLVEGWADWLNQHRQQSLVIEGHADERGTREYNLALGNRRANAVMEYLVALGVDSGRLSVVSYGKERPEALGSTETAYAKNRRGVLIVR